MAQREPQAQEVQDPAVSEFSRLSVEEKLQLPAFRQAYARMLATTQFQELLATGRSPEDALGFALGTYQVTMDVLGSKLDEGWPDSDEWLKTELADFDFEPLVVFGGIGE